MKPCYFERRNGLLFGKQELSQIVQSRAMFLSAHFGVEENITKHKTVVARGARRGKKGGALPMKPLGSWA